MKYFAFLLILFSFYQSSGQGPIKFSYHRNDDKSVTFSYQKYAPGSFTIFYDFSRLENARHPRESFVIKNSFGQLFKLKPVRPDLPILFSYKCKYVRGTINPRVDSLFTYLFPFKSNREFGVHFMSHLGHKYFSKELPKNWKAIQFKTLNPDTICAVRKGIVVAVTNKYTTDTTAIISFNRFKNSITIEHADGTFAVYNGLKKDQLWVHPGDFVYPNQPIGLTARYDKRKEYVLSFVVYYLMDDPQDDNKRKACYVNPYFLTSEGTKQLRETGNYTCILNEETISQEMRKREFKKWKEKHKDIFH